MDERKELFELIEYKYRCMKKHLCDLRLAISQNKQSFPLTPTEYNKINNNISNNE